ncbi:MAG: hypothetical protein ACE5PV_23445, partial [Candidatus Poribacteria bacterium]
SSTLLRRSKLPGKNVLSQRYLPIFLVSQRFPPPNPRKRFSIWVRTASNNWLVSRPQTLRRARIAGRD